MNRVYERRYRPPLIHILRVFILPSKKEAISLKKSAKLNCTPRYISQNSVECATALLIYNYFPFCLQQIKDELSEVVAEIQNTDSADDR